jgi:flagellar protein FlaH
LAVEPRAGVEAEAGRAARRVVEVGVPGFQYSFGGLPDRAVYLLMGASGVFHELFAQQVLYGHLVERGRVAYYTVEQSSEDVVEEMRLYGMELQPFLDDGSWRFFRAVPPVLQPVVEAMPENPLEGRVRLSQASLTELSKSLVEALRDGRWAALGLDYLLNLYRYEEVSNLLLTWVGAARRFGGLHFALVSEQSPQASQLKTLMDGVLRFMVSESFRSVEGEIVVEKVRAMMPRTRALRFIMGAGGLEIETTARIG